LEVLEDRQLLSAIPAVSTVVGNEDFVLKTDGTLLRKYGYTDVLARNVASITVGLDRSGSGMVAYVKTDGTACEWSDGDARQSLSNPALHITNNVRSVAASTCGSAFVLRNDSELFFYEGPASKQWLDLSGNVRSISAGTDSCGLPSCAMISAQGIVYTWSLGGENLQMTNPSLGVTNNIRSVSAGQGGVVFILRNDSELFYFNTIAHTWTDLSGSIRSVSATFDPNASFASCDVVGTDGTAYVWSSAPNQNLQLKSISHGITNNIRSASRGGNGISDVVLNDGTLWQFNERTGQWTWLDSDVA
jgi:hypothetical protein